MDAKNHKAYVSTGHLPPREEIVELVEEAHERFKSNDGREELAGLPGAGPRAERSVRHLRRRDERQRLRGRRRGPRVHDHERLQAVHLRPGLRGTRRRGGPREDRRQRHRPWRSIRSPASSGRRRPHEPDGQRRRDRHDEPRAGRQRSRPSGSSSTTGLSRFAGRTLPLNDEVYASASSTNFRNQASPGCCRASTGSTSTRPRRPTSTRSSVRSTFSAGTSP